MHTGSLLQRQIESRDPLAIGRVASGGEPQHPHGHHVADRQHVDGAAGGRGGVLGLELARPGHGRERHGALRAGSQLHPRLARGDRDHDSAVDRVLFERPGARRSRERLRLERLLLGDALQVEHHRRLGPLGDLHVSSRQRGAVVVQARGVEADGRAAPALPLVDRAQPVAHRLLGGRLQARVHRHFDGHAAGLDGRVAVLRDELAAHLLQVPTAGRIGRERGQRDRFLHLRVVLRARDVVVRQHAIEHVRLAPLGAVGVAARIDAGGALRQAGQDGCLAQIQVPDVLVEIVEGRFLDPVARVAEVDLVQVEEKDVVLGEVLLQPKREQHLLQLALELLFPGAEEEVLHHLLRDGRGAQPLLSAHCVDERGADQGERIEARVLVEILVFRRDQGVHEHARDLVHRHDGAAFPVELPHDGAVPRHHLGGHHRVVVPHRVERGDLACEVQVAGHQRKDEQQRGGAAGPGGAAQPDLPARRPFRDVAGVIVGRHGPVRLDFGLGGLGQRLGFRGRTRAEDRGRPGRVVVGRRLGLRGRLRLRFWFRLVGDLRGLLVPPRAAATLLLFWCRRGDDAFGRRTGSGLVLGQRDLQPLARRERLLAALLPALSVEAHERSPAGGVVSSASRLRAHRDGACG